MDENELVSLYDLDLEHLFQATQKKRRCVLSCCKTHRRSLKCQVGSRDITVCKSSDVAFTESKCMTSRSACNFADIFTVHSALEILSPILRKKLRQVFVASQCSYMKRAILSKFCRKNSSQLFT